MDTYLIELNYRKFLTHGELTADTLTAQQEEEQRRKRLEEQKNAASLNGKTAILIDRKTHRDK